jgi:hypothetical protein
MNKFFIFLFIIFLIFSCARKNASLNYKADENSVMKKDISTEDKNITNKSSTINNGKTLQTSDIKQQLIKTGNISYNVSDLEGIEGKVKLKLNEFKGYVFSSNYALNSLSLQLKIPNDKFDDFMNITGTFGKISSKSINVEDVTLQFYDLENRIKNKRIQQQRLQKYLSSAVSIDDLIKVEAELNRVTDEVESIEGQFKNMSNLISYSTLNLNFYVPGLNENVKEFPSFRNSIENFFYAFLSFLRILFFIVLGIICFGIPIIVILALLYYISFGKIGWIKKLFRYMSGNN